MPSELSASRKVSNGVTTWEVVGLDKGLVFKIDASKPSGDWHGDTMRDDGKEESVSLTLFKAATLVSVRFQSKRVQSAPTEKRHETRVTGRWTFEFESGDVAIASESDDAASLVAQFLTILRDSRSAPPLEEA